MTADFDSERFLRVLESPHSSKLHLGYTIMDFLTPWDLNMLLLSPISEGSILMSKATLLSTIASEPIIN